MILSQIEKANHFIKQNKQKVNGEYRHNYHLMGEYGWINDPNGFIQYKGLYHLFFQYYPYGAYWGPMHWGHAVSEDLIKWKHLPVALAPDCEFDKDGCFSGSSIEKDDKLYLMYTGHVYTGPNKESEYRQMQCLAFSYDGINFTKLDANPVIGAWQIPENASKKDFRDPKVFKRGEEYYAVLGSNDSKGNGQVLLYKSHDLVNWEFVNTMAKSNGTMGYTWECPDVFSLQGKDILVVSPQYLKPQGNNYHNLHSSIYMIGNLDTEEGTFKFDQFYPLDFGFDFYAPQTIIDNKGRRLMIAWMDMWESPKPTSEHGHHWAGAMTLPREVILKGDRLYFKPVDEIKKYRKNENVLENFCLNGEKTLELFGDSYELQVTFDAKEAVEFGLKLRVNDREETVLSYNRDDKLFRFNRDQSGMGPKGERRTEVDLKDNRLRLHIFVDKCSVEVFINDSEKVMTGRIYPSRNAVGIKAFSKGKCNVVSLKKWDIE